ncbi:MAG TPA: MFS transporter [Alphaproteobacteria bacterium]|jgi:MFS family permease
MATDPTPETDQAESSPRPVPTASPAPSRRITSIAAFRYADFRYYWASRFITSVAVQMQVVAIGWQVYELTHDPLMLGFVGLAEFLPSLLLALVTGAASDRFDRRMILTICYTVETLCATAFFLMTWYGLVQVWPVFAVLVTLGIARAFSQPAQSALMPNLVPREHFGNAVAWSSLAWQIASIGGPALGGAVLALFDTDIVFITAAVAIAASTVMMACVHAHAAGGDREPVTLKSLLGGFIFMREKPIILGAISLDLAAVLLGGAVSLLPVYASDILKVGPEGLGMLRAAPGVGAFVVAFFLTQYPIRRNLGHVMFACVMLWGVCITIFGFSTVFWVSLIALGISGAADMVSVFIRQNIVQIGTPDVMRGRVSAVNSIFIGASNELGAFRAGVMGSAFGAVGAVLVGGIATIVVTAIGMKVFGDLRKLDKSEDAAA